jgi:hypothetical protein
LDVFISHDHTDASKALRLARALEREGLTVWLDRNKVRAGTLLANAIMEALHESRNIVVLWSRASAQSDWVQLEWTTVLNLNLQKETVVKKGISACRLDGTAFSPRGAFLVNYPYYDFKRSFENGLRSLLEGLGFEAPLTPRIERYKPSRLVSAIVRRQREVLEALATGDVAGARALQTQLKADVRKAHEQQPSDRYVMILDGYNTKNEYMIRHWDDLQAGRPPRDHLLERAKQIFLRVLARYPDDPEALNGVGSVLIFLRDLQGAEFYIRRALSEREKRQSNPPAAHHAVELFNWLRA